MENKVVIGWWRDWVGKQESDKFVLNGDEEVVVDVANWGESGEIQLRKAMESLE